MQAIQKSTPNYSSGALQRTATTAEEVTEKNIPSRATESAAANKSISEAYERDVRDEYDVREERDVQDEGDQYHAYDQMSRRDQGPDENEPESDQSHVEDDHANDAEDPLEQFGNAHGSYHSGNVGYAETVYDHSQRSFHQAAVEETQYKPGWLSTFWRR
jgi:hypothetical protein